MKKFWLSFIVFGLIASCSGPAKKDGEKGSASSEDPLNIEVEKFELENGLRVVVAPNTKLPIMSLYIFYGIGGRHEGPGTTGASHFLEHLMFKETKNNPPGYFDHFIEAAGGNTNAYTSFDSTVYYESLPSSELETILKLESQRMSELVISPVTFEAERRVVLEERKYRYENSPFGKLYTKSIRAMYEGTPYGGSVIGDEKDVKNIGREQVFKFYQDYYAPNNATMVITGDVDPSEVKSYVEKYYGQLKFSKHVDQIKKAKDKKELYEFKGRYSRSIKVKGQSPSPIFLMAFKGEPWGSRESLVLDLLSNIIGGGQSSYLYNKYVLSKRPLLNSISAGNYVLKYNGLVYIHGELLTKTSLKSFKKKFFKDLKRVCSSSHITERSFQKTKNQFLIGYYNDLQSNSGVAHLLGKGEHFSNDYNYFKKEVEIYNSITVPEIISVCKKYLTKKNSIFTTVWNKHK